MWGSVLEGEGYQFEVDLQLIRLSYFCGLSVVMLNLAYCLCAVSVGGCGC